VNTSPASKPRAAQAHYTYLDGLRGLAAAYVVLHHAFFMVYGDGRFPPSHLLHNLALVMIHGQVAVDIFIVLSGFALTLPLVSNPSLKGGLEGFFARRARRILPPYYAALILILLLYVLVPILRQPWSERWAVNLPVLHTNIIVAHALLIHNLNPDTLYKIDYPMWSVATEWQIYFVFALILLPIWQKYGLPASVALGFLLGYCLDQVYPWACFHFIDLFAMGMAGAVVAYGPNREQWARVPWGILALAFIPCAIWAMPRVNLSLNYLILSDVFVGLAVLMAILHCARNTSQAGARRTWLVRLLESRPAVQVGIFSYSLYLIHAPVLGLVGLVAHRFHAHVVPYLLLEFFVAYPLAFVVGWGFHLAFERPFLVRRKHETLPEIAQDAALSPAP
jgi:peptidoglycan/LPS O-acetylase OafA/YrhL